MKEFKDDTSSKKRNEDQPLMRAFTECDDEEEKSVSVNGPMKKIQETRNLDKSTNSFKLDFS
jgi:hypothetical protein